MKLLNKNAKLFTWDGAFEQVFVSIQKELLVADNAYGLRSGKTPYFLFVFD